MLKLLILNWKVFNHQQDECVLKKINILLKNKKWELTVLIVSSAMKKLSKM